MVENSPAPTSPALTSPALSSSMPTAETTESLLKAATDMACTTEHAQAAPTKSKVKTAIFDNIYTETKELYTCCIHVYNSLLKQKGWILLAVLY